MLNKSPEKQSEPIIVVIPHDDNSSKKIDIFCVKHLIFFKLKLHLFYRNHTCQTRSFKMFGLSSDGYTF